MYPLYWADFEHPYEQDSSCDKAHVVPPHVLVASSLGRQPDWQC